MTFLQKHLLTLLLGFSIALFLLARALGIDPEMAVLAISVVAIGAAMILERRLPFRQAWREANGDQRTDWVSAVALIGIADPLAKAVVPVAAVWAYGALGGGATLAGLSLPMQIVLVTLVAEFGKYWAHRLHHRVGPLWWLHAMHHSSERLYVLNGLRFHPLNHGLNIVAGMGPVFALGASPEAVLAYLAISQPIVLIQHANIDLRLGWQNAVFSTPEAHRWHHSDDPRAANSNFGNAFLLWDHLFGTWRAAARFPDEQRVGLFADSRARYPGRSGYLTQLLSMINPRAAA